MRWEEKYRAKKKKTKKREEKKRKGEEERKKKKKKEKGRKKKKKKREKEKNGCIGGVEACGKAAGKGGSPEASGDEGGRLGEVLVIGLVLVVWYWPAKPDVGEMAFVG